MTRSEPLAQVQWRLSSFCGGSGAGDGGGRVEVAALPDGRVAVRNSNHPDAGTVKGDLVAWVQPEVHIHENRRMGVFLADTSRAERYYRRDRK